MAIQAVIAGNPNAGKTTLFNHIAGTNYRVGNYSGVTVEKKDAEIIHNDKRIVLTDLPGTYSLTAYSLEELVARDFIIDTVPDVIVNVVDASNLERNLYLAVQLLELGLPMILALNMADVAKSRGIDIDVAALSRKMKVPVVETVAREGKGATDLLDIVAEQEYLEPKRGMLRISYGPDIDPALNAMEKLILEHNFLTDIYHARWTALKYMENDEQVMEKGETLSLDVHDKLLVFVKRVEVHLEKTLNTYPEGVIADYRYGYVSSILKNVIKKKSSQMDRMFLSDRIDLVVTHRLFGPIFMLLILYGIYQVTFVGSELPVQWVEKGFSALAGAMNHILPEGLFKSLVIDGIIGGVGGIVGFAPLIFLMFIIIAVLEDSGYMARMAYMLDRVFRIFGLQGSAVVPYVVSGGIAGGCAVPGVMAARTIKGAKERLLTILTAPFMSCGAKIPVYAMIIAAFYEGDKGLVMLCITLLSWLSALVMAKLLGSTVIKGESSSFVMELPPYRFPTVFGVLTHAWERTWMYVKKAGTVILAISIILWVLMTFPGLSADKKAGFDAERTAVLSEYSKAIVEVVASGAITEEPDALKLKQQLADIQIEESMAALSGSVAGVVGTTLEPVSQLAGFDWRMNIALLGGFVAKEVIISTLGTAYSMGEVDPEAHHSLSDRLRSNPDWELGNALALIAFIMLYSPCFIAVTAIVKETGSWGWGSFTIVFYTVLAFGVSTAVFQLFS